MKRISTLLIWTLMLVMNQPAPAQDVPDIGYFNVSSGGGKVYLAWQLKAGGTCFGIQVHRSADGLNFEEIGGIEGVCGDLTNPESHSFTDDDPPVNQRVYYRLELGLGNFTEALEMEPDPNMVLHPRENPYIFYEEYIEEGDE